MINIVWVTVITRRAMIQLAHEMIHGTGITKALFLMMKYMTVFYLTESHKVQHNAGAF